MAIMNSLFIVAFLAIKCAMSAVTLPPIHGQFDYQIGGAYTPNKTVTIVSRDRGDSPATGVYSICYINAFQSQPDDKDWWLDNHPNLLLRVNGDLVEDPEWPDEYMLDTRNDTNRQALASIVNEWIDGCASDGYKGIEPDNLDSYTRSKGLITKANNLAFAKLLAAHAHTQNLAFGQKNDASITKAEATNVGFDFGIVEECQNYTECSKYDAVYGNQWIEIEYTDAVNAAQVFADACAARGNRISVIQRDRDVVKPTNKKYKYKICP